MQKIIQALLALALLSGLVIGGTAMAHGLLMSVEAGDASVSGRVYYSDGTPGAGVFVEMRDLSATDTPLQPAAADSDGRFSFPGVAGRSYMVVAHGEEGHLIEMQITMASGERGKLVDENIVGSAIQSEGGLPPAWMLIGGLLLLSIVPALWLRRGGTTG